MADGKLGRSAVANYWTCCTHPKCSGGPRARIPTTVLAHHLEPDSNKPRPACRVCAEALPKRTAYFRLVPGSERGLPPFQPYKARSLSRPRVTFEKAPATKLEKELQAALEADQKENKLLKEKTPKVEGASPDEPSKQEAEQALRKLQAAAEALEAIDQPVPDDLKERIKKAEQAQAEAKTKGADYRKVQAELNSAQNRANQLTARCKKLREQLEEAKEKAVQEEENVLRLQALLDTTFKEKGYVPVDEAQSFTAPPPEGLDPSEETAYQKFQEDCKEQLQLFREAGQRNLLKQAAEEQRKLHEDEEPFQAPGSPGKPDKKQRTNESTSMEEQPPMPAASSGAADPNQTAQAASAAQEAAANQPGKPVAAAAPPASTTTKEDGSWIKAGRGGKPKRLNEATAEEQKEQAAKTAEEQEAGTEKVKEEPAEESAETKEAKAKRQAARRARAEAAQAEREKALDSNKEDEARADARSRSPKESRGEKPPAQVVEDDDLVDLTL